MVLRAVFGDFVNERLMQSRMDFIVVQKRADLLAILRNTRSFLVGDEGQLGIHEDDWPCVDGVIYSHEDSAHYIELIGFGVDRLDPGADLLRICRIDYKYPITMAHKGQFLGHPRLQD